MQIIALTGFAGSGKSTAAAVLEARGYFSFSFADAVKYCLSAVFGWPRDLLEGNTNESRTFRETVDLWWAERLDIAEFTPRYAMQYFGTEVMRQGFRPDIWVLALEHRLNHLAGVNPAAKVVFPDVRYPNEMHLTRRLGGRVVRIRRGEEPPWYEIARRANIGDREAEGVLRGVFQIHASETAWIGQPMIDQTVHNDGTIEQFRLAIAALDYSMVPSVTNQSKSEHSRTWAED
jgi:hypothetical protein